MNFKQFLKEANLTYKQLESITSIDNMLDTPEIEGTKINVSSIEGKGLFTTKPFKRGEYVGNALVDAKRTNLGRFVNHSNTPNIEIRIDKLGKEVEVYTTMDIDVGEELTFCYMDNYNKQRDILSVYTAQ